MYFIDQRNAARLLLQLQQSNINSYSHFYMEFEHILRLSMHNIWYRIWMICYYCWSWEWIIMCIAYSTLFPFLALDIIQYGCLHLFEMPFILCVSFIFYCILTTYIYTWHLILENINCLYKMCTLHTALTSLMFEFELKTINIRFYKLLV